MSRRTDVASSSIRAAQKGKLDAETSQQLLSIAIVATEQHNK
jgi:hypothetical protein